MSITNATRRIIAIPLTRPILKSGPTNHMLTYYQFQFPSSRSSWPKSSDDRRGEGNQTRWIPQGGIVNWVTLKATETWAGFGKAEGGWKLRVYQAGERLVDRLDFEELALKGINLSLGPSITHPKFRGNEDVKQSEMTVIPLIYPPSIISGPDSLAQLRDLVSHRTPRHRKGFYTWMLTAPLTAPFMIIPIIPNLPFFFCVWRSWSHYKAYRASQYLESLVGSGIIVPEPNEALDRIYNDYVPNTPSKSKSESQSDLPQHTLLLTRDAVPAIINLFGLKASTSADLRRAVEQARGRV